MRKDLNTKTLSIKTTYPCELGLKEGIQEYFLHTDTRQSIKQVGNRLALDYGFYKTKEREAFMYGFLTAFNNPDTFQDVWRSGKNILHHAYINQFIEVRNHHYEYSIEWNKYYLVENPTITENV